VDVSGVQRTDAPTRDVYVVRQTNGDREFAGFGLESGAYCDTRVDADRLPLDAIQVGVGGVEGAVFCMALEPLVCASPLFRSPLLLLSSYFDYLEAKSLLLLASKTTA